MSVSCACCKPYIRRARYTQCHMKVGCNWPPSAGIKIFNSEYQHKPTFRNINNSYKIRILLLGSGSVGKSAVFKSIQHSHNAFTEEVLSDARHTIRQNLVLGMLSLLKKSQELYELYLYNHNIDEKYNNDIIHGYQAFTDKNLLNCLVDMNDYTLDSIQCVVYYGSETFCEQLDYSELKGLGTAIHHLWNLSAVQQTFLLRLKKHYSFPANMDFFFDKCIEVMSEHYIPTEEDALKLRVRTTGLIEYQYEDGENQYILFDVGGVRNERKKWIHLFSDISCVLYVTAINKFCKALFEDEKCIGLLESMDLFYEICNSKWFKKSVMVLLLNKTDLFRENIKITPLTFCFGNEYKGRNFKDQIRITYPNDVKAVRDVMSKILIYFMNINDIQIEIPDDVIQTIAFFFGFNDWWLNLCVQDGIDFITQKFMSLNENPNRVIYVYPVVAVDPQQIDNIMQDVQKLIIENRHSRFSNI